MTEKEGVRYGIRNVHIAWLNEEDLTYEAPLHLPGCRTMTTTPEGDTNKWYADDVVYFIGRANNGYSVEFEMAKIALKILCEAQGWEYDEENDIVYEVAGNVVQKPFALLYEVEGDITNTRFCFYRVTIDRPTNSWSTTEDGLEPQTETISGSVDPLQIGDKLYVKAMCELTQKNTVVFGNWFKAVHMPNAAAQPSEKTEG